MPLTLPAFIKIPVFSTLVAMLMVVGGCQLQVDLPANQSVVTDSDDSASDSGSSNSDSSNTGLSLTGALEVMDGLIMDLDTNDINAGAESNDDPANAQPLTPSSVVLGFVTANATWGLVSGSPNDENFSRSSDPDDYFLVSLSAGQTIQLDIADNGIRSTSDGYQGDLDLFVFAADNSSQLLYRSNGTSNQELVQVNETGNYLINVHAYAGASNYQLTLGSAAATSSALMPTDDFAVNEVLMRSKPLILPAGLNDGEERRAYSQNALQLSQSEGFSVLSQRTLGQRMSHLTLSSSLNQTDPLQQYNSVIYQKRATLQSIKQLSQASGVESAEPNYYRQALAVPTDTYYRYQWHYPQISLPEAWDYASGDGVIVAVIDTGVFLGHPELSGQLLPGYDFISSSYNANDGDGIDSNPDDPGDSLYAGRSSWHGTHVSGTIAALSNNRSGVSGIAPNSQIMPLRVLGLQGGTSADILQALYYSAGMANASGTLPERRADIVNLSLGGGSYSAIEQAAYQEVRNAGVIVVAAAGNSATSSPMYPAAYNGVISVAATDAENNPASYSNYGSTVDIAAPGGDVTVDRNGDGQPDGVLSLLVDDLSGSRRATYAFMAGTSMAAPHVAGIIALMKSAYPDLTPAALESLLLNGDLTDDLGAVGRDNRYGYGLINATRAVDAALQLASSDPVVVADPQVSLALSTSRLGLNRTMPSALVELGNIGAGEVQKLDWSSAHGWLSAVPVSIDTQGLGQYRIEADTTALEPGVYSSALTFNGFDVNENLSLTTLTVSLLISEEVAAGELTHHYVLLFNSMDKVVAETMADTQGRYEFSDILPGEYYIQAGSDMDVDLMICDSGESCGRYPQAGSDTYLELTDSDLSGLDILVSPQSTNAASTSGLSESSRSISSASTATDGSSTEETTTGPILQRSAR